MISAINSTSAGNGKMAEVRFDSQVVEWRHKPKC